MGGNCFKAFRGMFSMKKKNPPKRKKKEKVYLSGSDGEGLSSMTMRGVPEDRPVLSEETILIIVTTWAIIKRDMERVGVVMFMGLLEEDEVKNTFRAFRSKGQEELQDSVALRSHVLRVMGAVDKVVSRLHAPDKVVGLLHELGQKHLGFNARPEYLDLIGPQFIRAIQPALGDQMTPEVEQAWADIFRYITHVMKETMLM